jgi:signal transduction histidine kinase/putative methionine-R-sulfoxide reductase with GAF domain
LSRHAVARLRARVAALNEALGRARGVSEALREVGRAVGTTPEVDRLLSLIVQAAMRVVGAERGTLYLREGERLVSRVKTGGELRKIEVALGQGIAGRVAATGRPVRVADAYRDRRFDRSWDERSGYRTRSVLAVPLLDAAGSAVGVLQMLNKRGAAGPFTPYDTELLKALAAQAAVSLEKESLFRQLRHNNEQLEATRVRLERTLRDLALLYELELAMSHAEGLKELARSVVTLTARACSAKGGALVLEEEGGGLVLYALSLDQPEMVREGAVRRGEGVVTAAMVEGRPLRFDPGQPVDVPARIRRLLGLRPCSAIAAPLGGGGDPPTGALTLYDHLGKGGRFGDDDVALLKLVSANVATELRVLHARRAREHAERLSTLGRLLSGVMHDLRSPLTIVGGYVQLMQAADDPALRREHAEIVREQLDVIGAMLRDLLAYARGEKPVLVRKIYLKKFFEQLERECDELAQGRRGHLEVVADAGGAAYFDEGRMTRALHNLVRNALEAMDRGGRVRVSSHADGDDLVVAVSDDGPGIPRSVRGKLFQPFVTSGKADGTGLGLFNVKKIVEEHGGEVQVRSSRRGTTFTLRLPGALRPPGSGRPRDAERVP